MGTENKKIRVDLGDDLGDAKLNIPKQVPVVIDFQHKPIGVAELNKDSEGNVMADISLSDENFKKVLASSLNVGVSGRVKDRDGDIITDFDLTSVSIITQRNEGKA